MTTSHFTPGPACDSLFPRDSLPSPLSSSTVSLAGQRRISPPPRRARLGDACPAFTAPPAALCYAVSARFPPRASRIAPFLPSLPAIPGFVLSQQIERTTSKHFVGKSERCAVDSCLHGGFLLLRGCGARTSPAGGAPSRGISAGRGNLCRSGCLQTPDAKDGGRSGRERQQQWDNCSKDCQVHTAHRKRGGLAIKAIIDYSNLINFLLS